MVHFRYGDVEIDHLKMQDERLAQAIERIGEIERPVNTDLFAALISAIVAQQISSKAAATVWGRVVERLRPIEPGNISAVPAEQIQQCGMSMRKANYIRTAAQKIAHGEFDLDALKDLSDAEVVTRLSVLPGIGVWTAEMLMIFSMQRPDVVSWNDLAIRRGMQILYGYNALDKVRFEHHRQLYSPYGSVASLYLWRIAMEPI